MSHDDNTMGHGGLGLFPCGMCALPEELLIGSCGRKWINIDFTPCEEDLELVDPLSYGGGRNDDEMRQVGNAFLSLEVWGVRYERVSDGTLLSVLARGRGWRGEKAGTTRQNLRGEVGLDSRSQRERWCAEWVWVSY